MSAAAAPVVDSKGIYSSSPELWGCGGARPLEALLPSPSTESPLPLGPAYRAFAVSGDGAGDGGLHSGQVAFPYQWDYALVPLVLAVSGRYVSVVGDSPSRACVCILPRARRRLFYRKAVLPFLPANSGYSDSFRWRIRRPPLSIGWTCTGSKERRL